MQPKMIVEPYNQNLRCEMNRCSHKGQWAIGREGGPKAARTIWCDDCLRSITYACMKALPDDYREELLAAIGLKLEEEKASNAKVEELERQLADAQAEILKSSLVSAGVVRKPAAKKPVQRKPSVKNEGTKAKAGAKK